HFLRLLLEHGTNPNKGNDIKPLHIAAQIGNIKIAKLLLQYNADIDAKTYLGLTPLALAVISKNVEMAKFLIENNANVNAITKENDSIMHFSVELDDQTFIEYLIKHGAKISIKNAEGKTPIHECAKTNKINSLMALLNHGANINLKDNNGNTPLHLAVENQHEEMVKTILKYTKKVNIKNNDGNTPLHLAALKQNSTIFSMLIQNKANTRIKNNDGCTIIDYLWLHQNSYFLANYLTNKSKITNFFNNVSLNKTNAINSYLKTNIKFSVKDNYQKAKEVKELIDKLEKRKDVSEEDIFQVKRIGIILAVKAGNRELIEEYLESDGRLLYVRDEANKSLLEIAFEHLAIGIAMFLIEKGFDIDSFVSTSGNNILHYAAKIDDVDLAIYALIRTKGGLDINKRNAENETPLMIAKRRNSTDVLNVLIANGAIDNTMERIFLRKINVKLNQIKNKISKQFRKRYYDFNF
ncbi:MAG: ankyrin repeat domain-containing protein, partial [Candidatus Anstonellales archaeon]